jgi:hypothetical protein
MTLTSLLRGVLRAQRGTTRGRSPQRSQPQHRLPRPLKFYLQIWMGCFVTLPLDYVAAPYLVETFHSGLSILSRDLHEFVLLIGIVFMILPLARNTVINITLASQGYQNEVRQLSDQFNGLVSTLFALYILYDIVRRILPFGIEYGIGLVALGLLLFPTWYRSVKKRRKSPLNSSEILRQALTPERFMRSLQQFELLFISALLCGRIGTFVAIGAATHLGYPDTVLILLLVASALIFLTVRPTDDDLIRVCRKCGLWSHRAFQIENHCPGCARLQLKSQRHLVSKPKLSKIRSLLTRLDEGLEKAKLNVKKR